MRAPVLGSWDGEVSNPSLIAYLCEEKRLGDRDNFCTLCLGAILSCQDKAQCFMKSHAPKDYSLLFKGEEDHLS